MNEDEFKNWLKEQSQETCVIIAMRAAVRMMPFAFRVTEYADQKKLALLTARAIITSGVAGTMPTPEVKKAAASAVRSAAFKDTELPFNALTYQPIWHKPSEPDWLVKSLTDSETCFDDPNFSFWREFYQGALKGQPLDWALQQRVALIKDSIWEAGAEAVADEIGRIRKDFEQPKNLSDTRFPQYEPQNTSNIWDNPAVYAMASGGVYASIKRDIDTLTAEGINQFPEHFEPMKAIGVTSFRISGILNAANRNDETERVLREEIGRLTGLVISQAKEIEKLRAELEAAAKAGTKDEISPNKIAAVKTFLWLGGGLGAAISAVWALSGSDVRFEERVENLRKDCAYILDVCELETPEEPDPVFFLPIDV